MFINLKQLHMKKITLAACMLAVTGAFAQFNMPAYNPLKTATVATRPSLNSNQLNQATLTNPSPGAHYQFDWLDITTARDKNNGQSDSVAYYTNPVFMDSTAFLNSGGTNYTIGLMKAGSIVDVKSPLWDPNFAGNPILGAKDAFSLDSVFIGGYYQKVAADKTVGDTLVIEIAWGDTSTSTNWTRLSSQSLGFSYSPRELPSTKQGNTSHEVLNANSVIVRRVLTTADTVTVNNPMAGFIVVPLTSYNVNIPANNLFSVTYTIVPGKSSNYTSGKTVYGYGATAQSNGFAPLYGTNGGHIDASTNYPSVTHNYWKDQKAYYNAALDYMNWQRYGMAAKYGAPTFLDSTMLPEFDQNQYLMVYAITVNTTGIAPVANNTLKVAQNVPNPCSTTTYIKYELANNSNVALEVYDITGKQVYATSENNQFAGEHMFTLNTSNLQSGVYFYTLVTGDSRITKRMTVIN